MNELFGFIGIIICVLIIFYFIYYVFYIQLKYIKFFNNNYNYYFNGEKDNNDKYNYLINEINTKLSNELLIEKYKNKYEETILLIDECINLYILKLLLNIDNKNMIENLKEINILNDSKKSLNNIMNFIDKK